jgi:glucose-6-phosphate 1-dehydrogenase
LKKQNEYLQKEVEYYKNRLELLDSARQRQTQNLMSSSEIPKTPSSEVLSIVVVGASGDLAKKKTFPSLFALHCLGLLPADTTIYGFARSKMTDEEFRKFLSQNFKGWNEKKEEFVSKCFYHAGSYDSIKSFQEISSMIEKREVGHVGNRIFYLAIPPSLFVDVSKAVKGGAMAKSGWSRVIVEKPFGHDSESSAKLSEELGALFSEDQIYRIDHYLGKELVQNLMIMRFANLAFEPLWNRNYVSSVQIVFKEDIGTEGRGGYFDKYGIIRDVMQNHLLQILSLVAMEEPVSLSAEDVRDEKVKVLRACKAIDIQDLVIGQYTKDASGTKEGYLDDQGVPKDSLTPTFASAVIKINNSRWTGVPFILKCGKALNERKAEIRIQFQNNSPLFPDVPRNELVIKVQPDEAVFLKFNTKVPGLSTELVQTELDLSYKSRFDARLPDAYERLIYDVIRGDHNLFVRVDELEAAWKIFTPILHQLEKEKIKPELYEFGTRGPASADNLAKRYGFIRSENYEWNKKPKL